jgi:hypothetical protein
MCLKEEDTSKSYIRDSAQILKQTNFKIANSKFKSV